MWTATATNVLVSQLRISVVAYRAYCQYVAERRCGNACSVYTKLVVSSIEKITKFSRTKLLDITQSFTNEVRKLLVSVDLTIYVHSNIQSL